jgi:hypothetical protein
MRVFIGLGALVALDSAATAGGSTPSTVLRRSMAFQTAGLGAAVSSALLGSRWHPTARDMPLLSCRQGLLVRRISGGGGGGGGGQESEAGLAALTVLVLKERLQEMGLPLSGKKAELIQRILSAGSEGALTSARTTPAAPAKPAKPTTAPNLSRSKGGRAGERVEIVACKS